MDDVTFMEIEIDQISVGADRARALDPVWAEGLAAVIEVQGLRQPISLRKVELGYELVFGLHRLEAHRLLGRETIAATLSTAETADEARFEEVMENLARQDLIALDRCHHLYELKQVYERMYPQAKHGGDRGNQHTGGKWQTLPLATGAPEIFGFSKATAEQIGLSERSIRLAVNIWVRLDPKTRARLVGTDLAAKQTELKALADLKPAKQGTVLDLIFGESPAKNVAQALEIMEGGSAPSATEKAFTAANKVISALPEAVLDSVVAANEARILESLKRRGVI